MYGRLLILRLHIYAFTLIHHKEKPESEKLYRYETVFF